MKQEKNEVVQLKYDPDTCIATITLAMEGNANKINEEFGRGFERGLRWVLEVGELKGIIIDSAHKDFCVGADIDLLYRERDAAAMQTRRKLLNELFRAVETSKVPVVAALTGSALGGGYELALSCHRRIAIDDPSVRIGLPEVSLGVIPGAGGTQRLPRLIGFQAALENILQGKMVRAPKAKALGMVDELAEDREAVHAAAVAWIQANPKFKQPWDRRDFTFPAPGPGSEEARNILLAAAAMLYKKTAGAYAAPEAALAAVQEGAGLDFERSLDVEGRHFIRLAVSDAAKNMVRTFWYHRRAVEAGEGLPQAEDDGFKKVGILGAGMMGSGLAFVSALAGYDVVIKDIKQEVIDKAKAHCEGQAKKRLRHKSDEERAAVLGRISYTLELGALEGCDLIIEAVFEDLDLKHSLTKEVEPLMSENGVWASNTSAIPITELAKASAKPERFIGAHFFSPVEQMPLLEIIQPEKTSDETLGRLVTFAKKIKKLPIVVNDGYAFYTTRVFSAYLLEAVQLVAEGHEPALIEWAARQAGMVVSPLKVFDEVTLTLAAKGFKQAEKFGRGHLDLAGVKLVQRMVDEFDRRGKAHGKGFYDYDGERRIWPGLRDLATGKPERTGADYVAERLMLIQVNQVAHCLEEKILREKRDAEVGAIFGIGFAPNSGGPLAWIDTRGADKVVAQLDAFAKELGDRFTPPPVLREMAKKGERFFDRA